MCMSCGCGELDNDHGNPANITLGQMQRAAQAANIDVEHAADNIHHAARRYRDQQGGVAEMHKQNMAGGNYRTGDMLGTTSAAPNRDTTTDTNRRTL